MPVELRKRKAPPPAPTQPPRKKPGPKPGTTTKAARQAKAKAVKSKETAAMAPENVVTPVVAESAMNGERAGKAKPKKSVAEKPAPVAKSAPAVGDKIDLESFGGEVKTNEGEVVTLKTLVDGSKAGVVLFTYPRASTPGCTKQACLFRDAYTPLTATGLSIYGLSGDSPTANTTFRTKQKLPYPLLCDPSASLISAIGLKKVPKGTTRGVFVVDKEGNVLASEPGGPDKTVEIVKAVVEGMASSEETQEAAENAEVLMEEKGEEEGEKAKI